MLRQVRKPKLPTPTDGWNQKEYAQLVVRNVICFNFLMAELPIM